MPYALHSYKVDENGEITVRHVFYGATVKQCEQRQDKHADGCESYGPALEEERTIDFIEEIDALPDADELEAAEEIEIDDGH